MLLTSELLWAGWTHVCTLFPLINTPQLINDSCDLLLLKPFNRSPLKNPVCFGDVIALRGCFQVLRWCFFTHVNHVVIREQKNTGKGTFLRIVSVRADRV